MFLNNINNIKIIHFLQILFFILLLKINVNLGICKTTDKIVALVNNQIILNSDINHKINTITKDVFVSNSHTFQNKQKLYNEILDQLIINKLILQQAEQEKIIINHQQFNQIIDYISHKYNLTTNQFQSYINKIGLNYAQYCAELHQEIIKKIFLEKIIPQHINITIDEINNIVKKLHFIDFRKQFKIIHIIIELPTQTSINQINRAKYLSKQLIQKIKTNNNIQNIANTYHNNDIFPKIIVQETKWIEWKNIPVIFDQYLQNVKPNDVLGPLHTYDGIHIIQIKDVRFKKCLFPEIRVKIKNIKSFDTSNNDVIQQQLLNFKKDIENNNTTFNIILKDHDKTFYPENYENYLEWINLESFDPVIQKCLLTLNKNDISNPIYIDNKGWYLIQLLDINKLNYNSIIHERAYSYLIQQKFNDTKNNYIQKLKHQSYIKIMN